MSGLAINLKFEAERLTGSAADLLAIAKRLGRLASNAGNPALASEIEAQAESVLNIAEEVSDSAVRLVGR